MSHCKACDKILSSKEMRWYEDIKEHENLCSYCLSIALPHTVFTTGEPVQLEFDFGDDDYEQPTQVQQELGSVTGNIADSEPQPN